MPNTKYTQFTVHSFPRRIQRPEAITTEYSVWQDNPAPPAAPPATPQPAPREKDQRTASKSTKTNGTHQRNTRPGKDVQLSLWVRPVIKAELERIAKREGISVSATGEAFLEKALLQDLHTQHAATLDTAIDTAIGRHMRMYSDRNASLQVRTLQDVRLLVALTTNILSRQEGMKPELLEKILNDADDQGRASITRTSPQQKNTVAAEQQKATAKGVRASG